MKRQSRAVLGHQSSAHFSVASGRALEMLEEGLSLSEILKAQQGSLRESKAYSYRHAASWLHDIADTLHRIHTGSESGLPLQENCLNPDSIWLCRDAISSKEKAILVGTA